MLVCGVMLVSSCTTGAGTGAYAGGSLGSVLGSAIGGIIGGPRGSDIGTVIGMASGAVAGAAIGDAAEKSQREADHEMLAQRNQRIQQQKAKRQFGSSSTQDDIYPRTGGTSANTNDEVEPIDSSDTQFDPSNVVDPNNSGDDRIDFSPSSDSTLPSSSVGTRSASSADDKNTLEIRNVRFSDTNGDGAISGEEIGKVVFEIFNNSDDVVRNIVPTVKESSDNSRIYISPSITVENIEPHQGIRYTATIKGDRRLKDGQIKLLVSASRGGRPVSYVTVLDITTKEK